MSSTQEEDALAVMRFKAMREVEIPLFEHGISTHPTPSSVDQTCVDEAKNRLKSDEIHEAASAVFSSQLLGKIFRPIYNHDDNAAEVRKYMLPWLIPPVIWLRAFGDDIPTWLREESESSCIRPVLMGGTTPKPDYMVGSSAFSWTPSQMRALRTLPDCIRKFTLRTAFPFLICDFMEYEDRYNTANVHSCAIALSSILELYKAASEATGEDLVTPLNGKILVYSILYNAGGLWIRGHSVQLGSTGEHYFTFVEIEFLSYLQRSQSWNFVKYLYQDFSLIHMERIRYALSRLPVPPRPDPFLIKEQDHDSAVLEATEECTSSVAYDDDDVGFDQQDSGRKRSASEAGLDESPETLRVRHWTEHGSWPSPTTAELLSQALFEKRKKTSDMKEQLIMNNIQVE